MNLTFKRNNGIIDHKIDELLKDVGVHHPRIIRDMIISALKAGTSNDYLADLKLMRTTMNEMRKTNETFSPYRNRRKVTIFGSARTTPEEPIYKKCREFARLLAQNDYMVITGGGGGIMEAGNEGAGPENSLRSTSVCHLSKAPTRLCTEVSAPWCTSTFSTVKWHFSRKPTLWRCSPAGLAPLTKRWRP